MYFVYSIFNIINGKFYIGKTNNLQKRFTSHLTVAKGGKLKYPRTYKIIHSAINKYGYNNFIFSEIQSFFSEIESYSAEDYWIKYFDSRNPLYGYNISPGGRGSGSGINSANYGLKRSNETKQKLRESHLGDKNQNFGTHFSSETKAKISKNNGMRKLLGEKHPKSILTEEIVKNLKSDFNSDKFSKKELAIKYGINYRNVIAILNGYSWNHVQ